MVASRTNFEPDSTTFTAAHPRIQTIEVQGRFTDLIPPQAPHATPGLDPYGSKQSNRRVQGDAALANLKNHHTQKITTKSKLRGGQGFGQKE
jgi:hypothetical protein